MTKARVKCISLVLVFFAIGILIGGCLDRMVPRHNHTQLTVMKNGSINISPEEGDVIDWVALDPSEKPDIEFKTPLGSPCDGTTPPNECRIKAVSEHGLFPYTCGTDAKGNSECDPGSGPKCTTCAGTSVLSGILGKLIGIFDAVVFKIDIFLKLTAAPFKAPPLSVTTAVPAQAGVVDRAAAESTPGPKAAATDQAYVTCVGNQTTVTPTSIPASLTDTIDWQGDNNFIVTLQKVTNICSTNVTTPNSEQDCALQNVAAKTNYAYTVTETEGSCNGKESAAYYIAIQ